MRRVLEVGPVAEGPEDDRLGHAEDGLDDSGHSLGAHVGCDAADDAVLGQNVYDDALGRDSPIFLQFFYLFSIFFLNCF
jgi:hypothetical protein